MPDSDNHLFMVSTPLHLMVAIAIVDHLKLVSAHLVFIDQVEGKANPYHEVLNHWQDSPFKSVSIFYRPLRRMSGKLKHRKNTFRQLSSLIEKLKPAHIYTGNDRRIEFQYCMHISGNLGIKPVGYYLDEGAFTYVGRPASTGLSDRLIDNFFKKLAYGRWWKHPLTVGASGWIDTIFVSYPDLVHPLLKEKTSIQLTLDYWRSPLLTQFCQKIIGEIGNYCDLASLDMIMTLPHESLIEAQPGYRYLIERFIEEQCQSIEHLGVKYHPRDKQYDALGLASNSKVSIISREIPFEAMLPMLKPSCCVVGDFSTTLITTRLLRPDINIQVIDHAADEESEFHQLYKKLGINNITRLP